LSNYNTPTGGGIEDNCNITPETRVLECKYLGTLGGGQTTQMKVGIAFGSGTSTTGSGGSCTSGNCTGGGSININQPFSLSFEASGVPCLDCSGDDIPVITAPPAPIKPIKVEHFLTMGLSGGTSQLKIGETTSYKVVVSNSQTAPTAITNTQLKITFPEIVELTDTTTTHGNCSSAGTTISCYLDTLVSDTSVSVDLGYQAKLVGIGQVAVSLTSDQVPTIDKSSTTFSVIPQPPKIKEDIKKIVICGEECETGDSPPIEIGLGDAALMLLIDTTGSMGEEIAALVAAIEEYVTTANPPSVGLVTFKDDVTYHTMTNNMSTLLYHVRRLNADYGADCPEASLMALKEALPKLKMSGRVILVTDASSHADVNVDDLITALRAKAIRVDVILSGDDCVGVCQVLDAGGEDSVGAIEVFSRIAEETGGLFATPFEVNAGTTSGATKYHKVVLNVMRSAVSPSVISIMPSTVPQGTTVDLTFIAANTSFNSDSQVSFGDGITTNHVEVLSPTKMNVNVTISETASANFRDVTIVSQRGDTNETAKGLGLLEVVETFEEPQILSVTPATEAQNGTTDVTITAVNADFTSHSQLSFGEGISVQNVIARNQNTLTATINVSDSANLGLHKAVITTGSAVLANTCEEGVSPAIGSLLVTEPSTVPRLLKVMPEQGIQNSQRRLNITAINTHFVQDVTELSFGDQPGIYVLELKVVSETQLEALVQIDPEAELGFWDVFAYTDDEFSSLLDGFEVTPKGPCSVEGYITNKVGEPVADLELDTGELLGFSDKSGYFMIIGLWEGEHELAIEGSGYSDLVEFIVSDNTAINGDASSENCMVPLQIEVGGSDLVVDVKPDSRNVYQGDTSIYTITVTNNGGMTATGVSFTDLLPKGASFVSANMLDGGNCVTNEDDHSVNCSLPELAPNQSATVKIQIQVDQVIQRGAVNIVTVASSEYPPDVNKTWTTFLPYLSVHIKDEPDPVLPGGGLHYIVTAELSQYALSAATEVKLVSYLPAGLELKSVSSNYANCDTSNFPTITCDVADLDVSSAEGVSQVRVDINVVLKDPGLLLLINEVQVSAKEYPIYKERERTKVFIPPEYQVDMALVIDVTGSMQPEMNGVKRALKNFIAEIDQSQFPLTALVVFGDKVTVKAVTTDLNLVADAIDDMEASGGGTCPEASVEALDVAITHVKKNGTIFFVTDASPYEDADVVGISERIGTKEIIFNAVVTGDCSNQDSWNPLP